MYIANNCYLPMLKHTTHAAAGAVNGQIRNTTNVTPATASATATPTATAKPVSAAASTQSRNMHIRPPQPLTASTLNVSTISTTTPTLHTTTTNNNNNNNNNKSYTSNGGQRITNVLNINAGTPTNPTPTLPHLTNCRTTPTLGPTSNTHIKRITPVTHGTPVNTTLPTSHFHTYTNQYMLANNLNATSTCNFANTNHQHQHQHQHNHTNPFHNTCYPATQHKPQQNHISAANNNTTAQHTKHNNTMNLPSALNNQSIHGPAPHEALTSLGLLCLVSLLFALLSLVFLFKISPSSAQHPPLRHNNEDYLLLYDITLALCALSLSLNLCCLLVCAIQFLFAVKLVRSPTFEGRANKYLEKSTATRTCAVAAFFISIPIFLTGIILYTFNHFHSTSAIITSVIVALAIVFCGGAMLHNVFLWQKEKTITYRSAPMYNTQISLIPPPAQFLNSPLQHLNLNKSVQNPAMVLSTHHQPVSPNTSHASFNPLACGAMSTFLATPPTETPPTPKPLLQMANTCNLGPLNSTLNTTSGTMPPAPPGIPSPIVQEDRASVSPNLTANLDMSVSLYELSTLV